MIDQVITLVGPIKSIGFDAANVYFSNVQFGTMDGLKEKCGGSTKGANKALPLDRIHKVAHTKGKEGITIYFKNNSGKKRSYHIEGFNPEVAEQFIAALAHQAGFGGAFDSGEAKAKVDFTQQYLTLVGTVFFIPIVAWIASGPRTGRRSNLVRLAQDIGPMPIIILGVIIVSATLFKMYRMKNRPGNQTVYSRD